MLDQMFTAENFRRIYDAENRKGLDLAKRYFATTLKLVSPQEAGGIDLAKRYFSTTLKRCTLDIRNKVQAIRDLRMNAATFTAEKFQEELRSLKKELAVRKDEKSKAIDDLLHICSQKVLQPDFRIDLTQKTGPKGKPVFCIDAKPETFFVIKQLQQNIRRIYGVKQANRHDLVCQLRDMLDSKFPFELIRTDISSFYESINQKRLVEKLERDQLLSSASKKYIRQVLKSYEAISGKPDGIPRGVGISASLAELYLRPVDRKIRAIPGLVLHCRFVDDIVAVFARPPAGNIPGSFQDRIIRIFNDNGLEPNTGKTLEISLAKPEPEKFEYLGYCFRIKSGHCEISPSAAKVEKYEMRMNAAFSDYRRERPVNPKGAFRKLVGRVKFLTGNTRLSNSKSCAVTGIYYNNSLVTDLSGFDQLDRKLKEHIKKLKSPNLRERLKPFKFTEGFKQRRYHNFNTRELQTIVRAWKHG